MPEKIDIFKELSPRSRTYKLCGQGKKKVNEYKTNKHLILSYKNYLRWKLSMNENSMRDSCHMLPSNTTQLLVHSWMTLTTKDRDTESYSHFLDHKRPTRTPRVKIIRRLRGVTLVLGSLLN